MTDTSEYVQEPLREEDGLLVYPCDDGSECDGGGISPPMKKLRKGYSYVCGECQGNFR